MATKAPDKKGGPDKAGGKDWNKTRKILSIICLILLAIVAFRKWSRGTGADGGTAGQTVSDTVTVIADSGSTDGQTEATAPEASATNTPTVPILADSPEQTEAPPPAPTNSPHDAGQEAAGAEAEAAPLPASQEPAATSPSPSLSEKGQYTSKKDVALYIHLYGHLPDNFITKAQAKALGWGDTYSSVDEAAPGKSIGGDRFGNREGLLPKKAGRSYTECDIDTRGKKSRGAKRIVFSNDGLVYYTGDHYETFELLYGSE